MLKRKISKTDFDAAEANVQALYNVNSGNANEYVLDVEPDADTGPIIRARDREKARADAETALNEALTARVEELEMAATQDQPDRAALEAAYKSKEKALKDKHVADLAAKDKLLATILVDNKALELAQKISTVPELIVDTIKKRLKPDLSDPENPTTQVLDVAGLASTLSVEDLGKELLANPKYSAIMVGSNGSGGGARPNSGGSGASYKSKPFKDLNDAERTQWATDDPTGFKTASEAFNATRSAAA